MLSNQELLDERLTSSVTASGGGVGQGQTDLLGGVDDEDGADGQSQTLGVDVGGVLVVNHVVEVGNLALGVGDDGELQAGAGDLIDILDPTVVALGVVGTQTNELGVASSELRLKLGEGTELGGTDLQASSVNAQCNLCHATHGSEVIGVGEEDGPLVTDEVVEVDGTIGGLSIKVGGSGAKTEANSCQWEYRV